MTKYEQILREVSEACGEEILPASDRVAELVVEDTVVLVKPADAVEEVVSIFTVVLDGDADENILRKAIPDAWEGINDFRFLAHPEAVTYRTLNRCRAAG